MQILEHAPSDVDRYLEKKKDVNVTAYELDFERILRGLRRFAPVNANTRILEIGTGTGWFTTLCTHRGIPCKGIDISPRLIEFARGLARNSGVEPDFEVLNIEKADFGEGVYDFVVADSVFEHVQDWRSALVAVHRALKPGGVLFFVSTNKWCLKSGEFDFPLYGWLPDRLRYRLRTRYQGSDIMQLGIDFHQFTFGQLRRAFREIGFAHIYDRVQRAGEEDQGIASSLRRSVLRLCQRSTLAKHVVLTFYPVTDFVCIR